MNEKLCVSNVLQPRLAQFDENGGGNSGGGLSRRKFIKRAGGATAVTFLAWQGLAVKIRAQGAGGASAGSQVIIFKDCKITLAVGFARTVTATSQEKAEEKGKILWWRDAEAMDTIYTKTKTDNPDYYKDYTRYDVNPSTPAPSQVGDVSDIVTVKATPLGNNKWKVELMRNPASAKVVIRRYYKKYVGW